MEELYCHGSHAITEDKCGDICNIMFKLLHDQKQAFNGKDLSFDNNVELIFLLVSVLKKSTLQILCNFWKHMCFCWLLQKAQ